MWSECQTIGYQTCFNYLKASIIQIMTVLVKFLPEKVSLLLWFWWPVMQGVEDKVLEQLLVRNSNLDGLAGRTMLTVPRRQKLFFNDCLKQIS